jgi:serine/threonine-protein kinase RsbW
MTAPLRLSLKRRAAPTGGPGEELVDLHMPSEVADVEAAVELMAKHCFNGLHPCSRTTFRLRVALAEAISNAILRGNGEDPAKRVWIHAVLSADTIRLSVRDEGAGFDPAVTPAPTAPEALDLENGRGLFIIRHLADTVEFNERGNTIWMTLPRC